MKADLVNLERERLNGRAAAGSGWEARQSFAVVGLRGRLPSVLVLDSYGEAFARFDAHLILDPHARGRFEPRLIRYFGRAVWEAP